jgi:hypothetical protein
MSEGVAPSTRLYGHQLIYARLGWALLVVLTIGVLIASIPIYYHHLLNLSDILVNQPDVVRRTWHEPVSLQDFMPSITWSLLWYLLRFIWA